MPVHRGGIYLADLDPRRGTEPGKTRPVLVIQTDLLNEAGHPSTIVLPLTTKVVDDAEPLRVHVGTASGLERASDVLVDQPRAIDNRRLFRLDGDQLLGHVADVTPETLLRVESCLAVVLDLPGATLPS